MTDAQLLDRFLIGRDESAFAFLVARHGPMVLAVCRGVLRDRNDAEDAFQATFLVLFRKAGGLRAAGSLGSWLYRVAYRIAMRANAVAARRRERSSEEDVMAAEAASTGEAGVDRELLPIIHAEIDRLPDRYRAPIALCYLEGLSYEQAAHQLGWPIGTVGSRIARARDLLRSRLARRGVTATTAALSALLAREATAAPAAWIEATTRAAMGIERGGQRGEGGRGGLGGGRPQRRVPEEHAHDPVDPDDVGPGRRRDGRPAGLGLVRRRRGPEASSRPRHGRTSKSRRRGQRLNRRKTRRAMARSGAESSLRTESRSATRRSTSARRNSAGSSIRSPGRTRMVDSRSTWMRLRASIAAALPLSIQRRLC